MPDAMTDDLTLLFVYGTLKPGQYNFYHIEPWVRGSQSACVKGVLVDLGPYPALIEGDGIVTGIVLTVNESSLAVTDRIEGHLPDEAHCLYVRREVTITLADDSTERAWTYFFARPERLAGRPRLIVGHCDGRPVYLWPPQDSNPLPNFAKNESKS